MGEISTIHTFMLEKTGLEGTRSLIVRVCLCEIMSAFACDSLCDGPHRLTRLSSRASTAQPQ